MSVFRSVLFSFLIHLAILIGLIWVVPSLIKSTEPEIIELEWTPEREIYEAIKPREKKIVRQVELPEQSKLKDDETLARFLSEKTQRVQQESQAAQTGLTKNRSNQDSGVSSNQNNSSQDSKNSSKKKTTDDIKSESLDLEKDKDGYRQVDISQQLSEMKKYNDGFSSVGEVLPRDVKVGSFTALNTDRYLFYTFYARVEELIRYRWESRVQNSINSFNRQTRLQLADRNWVTEAEFILDKKGNLKTAIIMKSSGIKNFDLAAVEAFKEAKIFPNPPAEMIKEDGLIHLVFSFTVRFQDGSY